MFGEKIVKTGILGLSAPPLKVILVMYNEYFLNLDFKMVNWHDSTIH